MFVNYVFLFLCLFLFLSLRILIVMYVTFLVLLFIVLFCVLVVRKCVMYYYHRVSTQMQLTNISYHIVSYHVISYIISYIIYHFIISSYHISYRIVSYIISCLKFLNYLSLNVSHQNALLISLLFHTRHMPHLLHSPWFYHCKNIWWGLIITVRNYAVYRPCRSQMRVITKFKISLHATAYWYGRIWYKASIRNSSGNLSLQNCQ